MTRELPRSARLWPPGLWLQTPTGPGPTPPRVWSVWRSPAVARSPDPLDPWPDRLRASGRSLTWLSRRLDVSRSYLSQVASGARNPSPALLARIEAELAPSRLDGAGAYASRRADVLELQGKLSALLSARVPQLAPDELDELADELCRSALRTLAAQLMRGAEA